jgi:Methyltransferase domain
MELDARISMASKDAQFWDEWWKVRLSDRSSDTFPFFPHPLKDNPRSLFWLVNSDDLLAKVMSEHGFRTILCAGNGVSQEPRALAAGGFDVTALDISPVAVSWAEACHVDSRALGRFCSPELHRPGGRVEFVVGDLLDLTVCPGPFDVVVERRTVQSFAEHERSAALSALAGRLNDLSGVRQGEWAPGPALLDRPASRFRKHCRDPA